jgi:hypothetical protein
VIFVSTLMWFLNVVLPVIIGSYYVISRATNNRKNSTTNKTFKLMIIVAFHCIYRRSGGFTKVKL